MSEEEGKQNLVNRGSSSSEISNEKHPPTPQNESVQPCQRTFEMNSDAIAAMLVNPPAYKPTKHPFLANNFISNGNTTSSSMILDRVLCQRDLQPSDLDQIFGLSDYDIIIDLYKILIQLKNIFNDPQYAKRQNDQSVVELVLSRVTAAIRETSCIETYAACLVDLLEACLAHKMFVISSNNQIQDSPHCKIALELLSTLFLFHSKRSVMTVTIPVAIKALSSLNQELVRNTTSYLSLAAIHNGRIIASFAIQIITNILNGNYSLIRVLPQVYPENREPFHAHLNQLLRLLHNPSTETSERLSLLQLASMVANTKPDLIIPHLGDFDEFLTSNTTCTAVLHIFLSLISMGRHSCLVGQLRSLRRAVRKHPSIHQNNLTTIGKIVGVVGRACGNDQTAAVVIQDLIELCRRCGLQNLPVLLREIESVAEVHPASMSKFLDAISELSAHYPSTYPAYMRIRSIALGEEIRAKNGGNLNYPAMNFALGNKDPEFLLCSADSLHSSNHILPNDPAPARRHGEVQQEKEDSIGELDRNMQSLAECYNKKRSSGSLGYSSATIRAQNHRNHDGPNNLSFLSLSNSLKPQESSNTRVSFDHQPPDYNSILNPRHSLVEALPATGSQQQQYYPPLYAASNERVPQRQQIELVHQQSLPLQKSGTNFGTDKLTLSGRNQRSVPLPPNFEERTIFPVNVTAGPVKTTVQKSAMSVLSMVDEPIGFTSSPKSFSTVAPSQSSHASLPGHLARSEHNKEEFRNDVVYQFADHRRSKIKRYIKEFTMKYPIPINCTLGSFKGTKNRRRLFIHFTCQVKDEHCVFANPNTFTIKTKLAPIWMQLIFLENEVTSLETNGSVLTQQSDQFQNLAYLWQCLPKKMRKNRRFVNVVTSAFPSVKEQSGILKELQRQRYFDSFLYNAQSNKWSCFSCAYPEKARSFLRVDNASVPLLEGQLKTKNGRCSWLRPWQAKYFTLSSSALTSSPIKHSSTTDHDGADKIIHPSIELQKIRSVKTLTRGRKNLKFLKSFQVFTDDSRLLLKASDRLKAEEWFKSLQIAVAISQREKPSQIL